MDLNYDVGVSLRGALNAGSPLTPSLKDFAPAMGLNVYVLGIFFLFSCVLFHRQSSPDAFIWWKSFRFLNLFKFHPGSVIQERINYSLLYLTQGQ